MKKRMNIQTKLFLTALVFALMWLWIVWVTGTYAHAEMPAVPDIEYAHPDERWNRYYQQELQFEHQRSLQRQQQQGQGYQGYSTTPMYPNPNDDPNNPYRRQQLQREQDQMNQFFYNHQLQQQLQQNQMLQQQQQQNHLYGPCPPRARGVTC